MRIKFIQKWREYRPGEVLTVPVNKAKRLIQKGFAILSKDMTNGDYMKKDKE